jgi:HEPN domain-containing protein
MNIEVARKWFKQAKHDLRLAEKNITIEGYDIASFLAQQSVEKLLKSIFALEGKEIPRIHFIDDLSRQLGLSEEILDDVLDLTADYTLSRYPDVANHVPYEEYDEEIAREKVDKAKRIFERLRERYDELESYDKRVENNDAEAEGSDNE